MGGTAQGTGTRSRRARQQNRQHPNVQTNIIQLDITHQTGIVDGFDNQEPTPNMNISEMERADERPKNEEAKEPEGNAAGTTGAVAEEDDGWESEEEEADDAGEKRQQEQRQGAGPAGGEGSKQGQGQAKPAAPRRPAASGQGFGAGSRTGAQRRNR